MAVLFEYENGLAERLMRSRQAGSAQPFENVNQLSISGECGLVRICWFKPAMQRQCLQMHENEKAYQLSLQPKEGLKSKVMCSEIIHGVCMKWHERPNIYTLSKDDQVVLDTWLSNLHSTGFKPPLPSRPSRAGKGQKAQRQAGVRRA